MCEGRDARAPLGAGASWPAPGAGVPATARFVDGEGRPVDVRALVHRIRAAGSGVGTGATRASAGRTAPAPRVVVLVDGRSGTGKTTLADQLAAAVPAQVVHLDDVYPGWDGLRAAADAVVRDVLAPPDATGRPGWRRWDWAAGLPAGWVSVAPDQDLVVEGCGALSRAASGMATFRIWLDGEDDARRRRALDRDGPVFAREWDRWAAQEAAFIAEEQPREHADVVLRIAEPDAGQSQPSSCSRSSSMP
ncbi:ATP-binding protein [Curtobacterium sp. MCBD17_019]|uniref:ATP-binding protein n=1 Tax=Curtobacterium sp. MCBD17_019 TaxID=2175669 RepID=UPI0021ACDD20|nr:ATP-binding protein [Curtobacterium sp. MCBD17_019]